MLVTKSIVLLASVIQVYGATIKKRSGLAPQFSPSFPSLPQPTGVVTSYNSGPYDTSTALSTASLQGFPDPWTAPDTSSAEVQAAYERLDLSQIPDAPIREKKSDGNWVSHSDGPSDPYCWWTSSNCVVPKATFLPPDLYTCPKKGDWGLTYDDGPFILSDDPIENKWAEPRLLNYLADTNLHATLFYIGSNVVTFPDAARRGLNNGHQICAHTWSHPLLTTLTNIEIVAQLYWTLKAIKAATGVTTRCFRPPQGDIDDRVRAIVHQMGMRNILWDQDSEDWQMRVGDKGTLTPETVNDYFNTWIHNCKSGKDKSGHIVLEHEINHATVNMSISWLPKLKETFNVTPALSCNGITKPYWEDSFNYPLSYSSDNSLTPTGPTGPTTAAATIIETKSSSATVPSSTAAKCVAGASGRGEAGYCCATSNDCVDACHSGVCGP